MAKRLAPWLVWAFILAYVAYFGALTVQKHNAFQTTAFDLGNVDQAVWNTRHGRPLAMTNIEGLENRLGTHVEPILLPISLLYFLWSDPRLLLLLQTAVIALGAWPVYLLARLRLGEVREATADRHLLLPLVLALAYLLFPALQSANRFDFHAVALAPTFFLLAFYSLETQRWGAFALFAVLTMSCKEDMPLLVAMLGLYAVVIRRRWKIGLVTVAVAAIWFILAVGWVMPHFDAAGVSPLASRYAYLGDNPLEIAANLVSRPSLWLSRLIAVENLVYVTRLLAPVAFLPLLAPQVLLLAAPALAVNLLSTDGFMHQLEGFHYGVTLVPIVVSAAAYGAAWLIRRFPRFRYLSLLLAGLVLGSTLIYHRAYGYTPLAAGWGGTWPTVTAHHRLGQAMARNLPVEASVAALPYLNPHASQRRALTMIDRVEGGRLARSGGPLPDADYVWLDVTNAWPLHPNDLKAGVDALLAGDYGVDEAIDGWLLLRRGVSQKHLPAAFYDFARAPDPQPQYPLRLQFLLDGIPVLECLGFDLLFEPPTSRLQLYWRGLVPLPADLRLYPFYLDDATAQVLEDTTLRPMIEPVWYPPASWQPGEIVVTRTLPWDVGEDYSIGLGVFRLSSPEVPLSIAWASMEQRLPIRVELAETDRSQFIVRLFDGDTWARLLQVEGGEVVEERRTFALPSPPNPLEVSFGGRVRLLGYDLGEVQHDRLAMTLYWQALDRPDTTRGAPEYSRAGSYTVFVQLLGPAGRARAQADAVPRDGSYPMGWWLPGEVVADPVTLEIPPDLPREVPYRLIVGLYDPNDGSRLPVDGSDADWVELESDLMLPGPDPKRVKGE
jgi:uncharacterized membrane protein